MTLLDECRRLQSVIDSINCMDAEKLHTAYIMGDIVEGHLVSRNDLTEDERKLAEQAMDNLYSLYQIIGSKM